MHDEEFDIGWSNRAGKDILKIKSWLLENASETVAEKVVSRLYNAVEPTPHTTRTLSMGASPEKAWQLPIHQSLELQNHLRIHRASNNCTPGNSQQARLEKGVAKL